MNGVNIQCAKLIYYADYMPLHWNLFHCAAQYLEVFNQPARLAQTIQPF